LKVILLDVRNFDQMAYGAENGCEAASLLEVLLYKNCLTYIDYLTFLKELPIATDGNPYHGFGGSPFETQPNKFEAIFPVPLGRWARQYGRVENLSGAAVGWLYRELEKGNPVITFVTVHFEQPEWKSYSFGIAPTNNHAVVLDGVRNDVVHLSDPIDGQYWLEKSKFETIYETRRMAIVVK